MNQWIKFFQALVTAGLSPYQAEWVVRKTSGPYPLAAFAVRHAEAGDFARAFLHGVTWADIPGIHSGVRGLHQTVYEALPTR